MRPACRRAGRCRWAISASTTTSGATEAGRTSASRRTPHRACPLCLSIPALGVHTNIEYVGVDKDNNMDIPKDPVQRGLVQAGHGSGQGGQRGYRRPSRLVRHKTGGLLLPGSLKAGDRIYVRDEQGRDRAFVVTKQADMQLAELPAAGDIRPHTGTHLNLITCNGTYSRTSGQYDKRLVVFTEAAK